MAGWWSCGVFPVHGGLGGEGVEAHRKVVAPPPPDQLDSAIESCEPAPLHSALGELAMVEKELEVFDLCGALLCGGGVGECGGEFGTASILRGPVCGFAVLVCRCGCGVVVEEPFAEYVVGESREALVGCCLECRVAGGVEGCGHGRVLSGVAAVSGHWCGWRSRRVRQRTSRRRWRRGRGRSRSRSRMRGSSGFPLLCFGACVAGCECGGGQAWVVATSWVGVYGTVKASLTCTWPVI